MSLAKKVKIGGGYYKGTKCTIAAAAGNYTTYLINTRGAAINGISITPDGYGPGDTMKIEHYNDTAGTGSCMAILAEDIYNQGAGSVIMFDFPAMELVESGESIKFTYINTASVAMNVYLVAEYVGIKKTA